MGMDSQIVACQLARCRSAEGCGSPAATSKGHRPFEAPTEPTGETSSLQGSRVKPLPSDMMLCVISYWVLSGAKQRQIQQLRCCVLPAKLLKRRDVYLKLTRHNGRAGSHGTYNPKHNDRSFNLANSEHIDPERAKVTSTGTAFTVSARLLTHKTRTIWRQPSRT